VIRVAFSLRFSEVNQPVILSLPTFRPF